MLPNAAPVEDSVPSYRTGDFPSAACHLPPSCAKQPPTTSRRRFAEKKTLKGWKKCSCSKGCHVLSIRYLQQNLGSFVVLNWMDHKKLLSLKFSFVSWLAPPFCEILNQASTATPSLVQVLVEQQQQQLQLGRINQHRAAEIEIISSFLFLDLKKAKKDRISVSKLKLIELKKKKKT